MCAEAMILLREDRDRHYSESVHELRGHQMDANPQTDVIVHCVRPVFLGAESRHLNPS